MKLFASDYDGTYCKHTFLGHRQMKQNLKMTKRWQEAGNLFVFATGRDLSLMKIEELFHGVQYDYIIGLNGAIIMSKGKRVLFRRTMSNKVARDLVAVIQKQGILNFTITDGMNGYAQTPKKLTNKMFYFFQMLKYIANIYTRSLEEALNNPVAQISVKMNCHQEATRFANFINQQFGDEVMAFANLVHVDISAKGVSKATGIEYLTRIHQLDHDQVYCIGDSFNDLPMIETFNGFTMIEACDELKEKSKGTFQTVSDAILFVLS